MTTREVNQNFSKVLARVEAGETVVVTKHGRPVAEIRPRSADRRDDPVWRANRDEALRLMRSWPRNDKAIAPITMEDKYGDVA